MNEKEDEQVQVEKPSGLIDEHLEYLDRLRESGETNMFGAASYLQNRFAGTLTTKEAKDILLYWMETFGKRHPKG